LGQQGNTADQREQKTGAAHRCFFRCFYCEHVMVIDWMIGL
jgi:hypothetical protein